MRYRILAKRQAPCAKTVLASIGKRRDLTILSNAMGDLVADTQAVIAADIAQKWPLDVLVERA